MQVNYTKPFFLFCFVCFFVLLITEWTGLSLVLKGAMSQGCCWFWSIMWLLPNLAKANFDQISKFPFVKFWRRNSIQWKYRQSFHLSGHNIGFLPQTRKLPSPYKIPSSTLAVKGLSHKYSPELQIWQRYQANLSRQHYPSQFFGWFLQA